MQTEKHTQERLVLQPSFVEVQISTAKFKRYTLPGVDQILPYLIQA
jgi:hypothetical protein